MPECQGSVDKTYTIWQQALEKPKSHKSYTTEKALKKEMTRLGLSEW